jgi:hypothetical protein
MIADKKKRKEIEKAKKSHRESVSIGTTHALEILGKSTCVHPVCPLLKRVETSQSVQTSQSFLCPQHSESIEEGMQPTPQCEDIKQPPGEPPQSWSIVPTMEATCDINSVAWHPAAREILPAQTGASTEARHPAAREILLAQTGASTVEEQQSSRKHCMGSQLIETWASARSTQSTQNKHVKRPPKRKVSWREPVSVNVITDSIRQDFQGISGVEKKLRTRNVERHEATPKTQESDPNPGRYQRVNPLTQSGQIRSDNKSYSNYTNRQTDQETRSSQQAFPVKLIKIINKVRAEAIPAPMPPEFVIKMTEEVTENNFMILKRYDFDLAKAIHAQRSSPLGYGSEFRPPKTLMKIFKHHPLWGRMERLLIKGSKWPLTEISKSSRMADLTEALQFGNHKGGSPKPDLLKKLISDDIRYGYGLVIPWGKIPCLPNACLAPMNITMQFTLDAGREIVDKERLTHDQSFKWQLGLSVNKRVIQESLQRCMYATALLDSGGKKKVPKCTNCTPEDGHQVCLPTMPP